MALLRATLLLAAAGGAQAASVITTTTLSLSTATNTFGSPTSPIYAGINHGAYGRGESEKGPPRARSTASQLTAAPFCAYGRPQKR